MRHAEMCEIGKPVGYSGKGHPGVYGHSAGFAGVTNIFKNNLTFHVNFKPLIIKIG
jgi:hypothetical protein